VIVSEQSRKIDLGTHALRVRETGNGSRTVICLHDFLDGAEVWDALAEALGDTARLVLVEQRAHGFSSAPEGACTVADLGSDVVALAAALGADRPLLVGHGLGALAALQAAVAAPGRFGGLVLVSPFAELDARQVARWRDVVRAGEVNKLQGLARSVFGPTSRREVEGDGIGLTEIARALQEFGSRPLTPRLAEILCPTVVVAGGSDAAGLAPARAIVQAIPGARLETVAGSGGALHTEAPADVARAVRSLLAAA
jgi:3-oxoadipate enol-lactonase